jgi:hypothetical protein
MRVPPDFGGFGGTVPSNSPIPGTLVNRFGKGDSEKVDLSFGGADLAEFMRLCQ